MEQDLRGANRYRIVFNEESNSFEFEFAYADSSDNKDTVRKLGSIYVSPEYMLGFALEIIRSGVVYQMETKRDIGFGKFIGEPSKEEE